MEWVRLMLSESVAAGGVQGADVAERELVIWRTSGGRLVAMDARCPHQWSYLGIESEVHGDELVCTSHFWRFGVDGEGSKRNLFGRADAKSDIAVYPTRERDGYVEVLL